MPASTVGKHSPSEFETAAAKARDNLVHYFKPVDKGSSMPSWYHEPQMEEMEEWVSRTERQLKADLVPKEKRMAVTAELRQKQKRIEAIKEAYHDVKKAVEMDTNAAGNRYKELTRIIKNSMFTRDEMFHKPRLVNPREEANRMGPRSDLIREFKILGRILGENTNPEYLRK